MNKKNFILNFFLIIILILISINLNSTIDSSQLRKNFHNPIIINGNNEFNSENGVVKGSGSKINPYIIENWSIETTNNHGIYIKNSDVYFIIRNCSIFYPSTEKNNCFGIFLQNVKNGNVKNNIIENTKCGIYISNSKNILISDNICKFNYEYNMIAENSFNIIIKNNKYINSWYGIYSLELSESIILNNSILNQEWHGITLYNSFNNTLINNTCKNNSWHGIFLHNSFNNSLINNTCNNNSWHGIYLKNSKNQNLINSNCNYNKWSGIVVDNSSYNILNNNFCKNNTWNGINLFYSFKNDIKNNTCTNNKNGINIQHSNLISTKNNKCSFNLYGLLITDFSNNDFVSQNIFNKNKQSGIQIESYSNNNKIINNKINQNDKYGIYLKDFSYNNFIQNNFCILNNEIGIIIRYSDNNQIYNNYFNNLNNYEIFNSKNNNWNISKTLGKNILGGPIIGGNYWSNYKGIDKNNDGIGDTKIPYGPGDYLPLIKDDELNLFGISDNTTQLPITGEEFNFYTLTWAINKIKNVYVDYWFNDNNHINVSMKKISGNDTSGAFSKTILISVNTIKINYNFSIIDRQNNWKSTNVFSKNVIDSIKPTIVDNSMNKPTTGDYFVFNVTVSDNIKPKNLLIKYWIDNNSKINISINITDEYSLYTIIIPDKATKMHYSLSALDNSNNLVNSSITILNIIDNDPPFIYDKSNDFINTGESYTIEIQILDNIKLSSLYLNYSFNNELPVNISFNGSYILNIPYNGKILSYTIYAYDDAKNLAYYQRIRNITDNDSPIIRIISQNSTTTGDIYNISAYIEDNIDNCSLKVNLTISFPYRFYNESFNIEEKSFYHQIIIPNNISNFTYIITVFDCSYNIGYINKYIVVIDDNKPLVTDNSRLINGKYKFILEVYDNIGIKSVEVEFNFDKGSKQKIVLKLKEGIYQGEISIPGNANKLFYKSISMDETGNLLILQEKEIELNNSEDTDINSIIYLGIIIILLTIISVLIFIKYYLKKRKSKK